MVLRPSLKRGVPGSVPPWRAPCFSWPCRGFGLPGVFFVALPWFSTSNRSNSWPSRWVAAKAASRSASCQLGLRLIRLMAAKSQFLQLLPSRDAQLRPTTRSRNTSSGGARSSSISKSLGLSALCAVETAPFAARRSFC